MNTFNYDAINTEALAVGPRFEVVMPHGTTVYCNVQYNLGDFMTRRGYSLHVQRKPNTFVCHAGLDNEKGANQAFLLEVTRKSKKAEREALSKIPDHINKLVDYYDFL